VLSVVGFTLSVVSMIVTCTFLILPNISLAFSNLA